MKTQTRIILVVLTILMLICLAVLFYQIWSITHNINISLSPEAISGLFGLFGVIVGVLLTNYYNNSYQKLQKKKEITKEYMKLYSDIIFYLRKYAKTNEKTSTQIYEELDNLELEIFNKLDVLNINVWDAFKNFRVKAAYNRLYSSLEIIQKEVLNKQPLNFELLETSNYWIRQQWNEVLPLMMAASKITVKAKKKLIFVGFRKLNASDKAALKFDVKCAPWIVNLELDFVIPPSSEQAKKIRDVNIQRYSKLKCKEHGYAPHVVLSGHNCDDQIHISYFACCDNFLNEIDIATTHK